MKRRRFLYVMGGLASLTAYESSGWANPGSGDGASGDKIVGMYIHQHWPYNHPYAARTWTVEDYRGYADGLKKLGFNTLVIWPILETMPDPLTPSDQANLEKIGRVIDMLHDEVGMRVFLTLCPNIVANNQEAAKSPFQKRHFFYSDQFVDPGDSIAVKRMVDWREKLLRPLAKMDGIAIIDSDPGGYPGSTNAQFANLLGEHRKMLNRLRPGIRLCYWMHVGWEGYCRFYQTANFEWGTPAEAADVLTRLKKLDLKPWGITIHTMEAPPNGTDLKLAEKFGLASNALAFNYGAIEAEPSFPMTNFGGDGAFKAGQASAPGGVVGNAQTHCVQLPNTFALARGATGKTLPIEPDYVEFANGLISGQGRLIVQGWKSLAAEEPEPMRGVADKLEALTSQELTPGPLKGLLFGDPKRFITDLVMELRLKASYLKFVMASEKNQEIGGPLQRFIEAAEAWQKRHGYECAWSWPRMTETLKTLKSPAIDAILDEKGEGPTPTDRVADQLRKMESDTSRLLAAMRETVMHLQ